MKATVTAPLGPAAQRKADQKALRKKLATAKKLAKKAPAKKAAKKAAARPAAKAGRTVTPPPAPARAPRAARPAATPAATETPRSRSPRLATIERGLKAPDGSKERIAAGITALRKMQTLQEKKGDLASPVRPEVVKPGRPDRYNWSVVEEMGAWRDLTDKEIAALVGCSAANVCIRRGKAVKAYDASKTAKERKDPGYVNPYVCKRGKWAKTMKPEDLAKSLADK